MTLRFTPPIRLAFSLTLAATVPGAIAALQPIDEAPVARTVDMRCRIHPDTSTDCTTDVRLTILRPAGREMISRLDFRYLENDRLEIRDAAVIQPDGARVPLAASQIDTRTAPNPAAGLRRTRQTSLAYPGLRVGSTVVYTRIEHTSATPLTAEFHERLTFGPRPIRDDRYRVEFRADRPIMWRGEQMEDYRVEPSGDGRRLVIELRAPRYVNLVNEADSVLRRIPRIEIASSLSAQDHFGPYAARYDAILSAPLPPAAAAAVAEARMRPEPERVAALLRHIDTHYRYLGDWRASERGYVPFELEKIEANGYGDCKDLAILLAAMLNASGIAARPAWVSLGTYAPPLLIPGTRAPNHVVVRAVVDGRTWWLDPTSPTYLPGRTLPDLQDRWALVAEPGGRVREEHIAAEAPTVGADATLHSRIAPDGSARIDGRAALGGLPLLRLLAFDRDQGASVGDRRLCTRWFNEPVRCDIERPRTDSIWSGPYAVRATGEDRNVLERVSGKSVYDGGKLRAQWEYYADYRQSRGAGDLYLSDATITEVAVRLDGVRPARPLGACAAHSPWFDLDVTPESRAEGLAFRYRFAQKVRWLGHDDLAGDAFGRFLDDARRCTDALRQTVTVGSSS